MRQKRRERERGETDGSVLKRNRVIRKVERLRKGELGKADRREREREDDVEQMKIIHSLVLTL